MTIRQLSSAARRSLDKRAWDYHSSLLSPEGHDLYAYLTEERGLTDETIRRFRLGAVVDPDGLDETARGWLAIPYITPTGVVALRFRRPPGSDDSKKYWQPPGSDLTIFNTPVLADPRTRWVVITEGEFDAMIAAQCGLPAIGIPGASAWQDHYTAVFEGYERVIICGDNDDTGAGKKFAAQVAKDVPNPAVMLMPEGHDVNSYFLEYGARGLREYLKVDRKEEAA